MKRNSTMSALGFCVLVTISLWLQRTGGRDPDLRDLAGSVVATCASVALGWMIGRRMTAEPSRQGFIALIAGIWGLLFNTFYILAASNLRGPFEGSLAAAIGWTSLCVMCAWLAGRGKQPFTMLPRLLTFSTWGLLAGVGFHLWPLLTHGGVSAEAADKRDGARPDVFVIVLDKYTSGAWLLHNYGLDHEPFEDSLRALGFVVPAAARANYVHTLPALASFLNSAYLDSSREGREPSPRRLRSSIQEARVWTAYARKGYRIVTFPTGFFATSHLPRSDAELRAPYEAPSPFAATWLLNSVLGPRYLACAGIWSCRSGSLTPYPTESLREIKWKLGTLASLPDSAGPIFAFVHVLVPHEPYLFEADCTARNPWWPSTDQGENFQLVGEAYVNQVTCLDRLLLEAVRSLIRRSKVSPVIVLQGDHGHGRITTDPLRGLWLPADRITPDQKGERLGVFAAYRFPGADTVIYADISPVNILPMVEASIFGGIMKLLPDSSFWPLHGAN